MLLQLDYLRFQPQLRLAQKEAGMTVFDPVRKREVALTPEELLRQLVLLYLLEEKKYPVQRIRSEIGIEVNGLRKRCDLVVFDPALQPWLLIECKSPKVALEQSAFEQAARYNLQLNAPYLAITNGLTTFCCALDLGKSEVTYLDGFPDYEAP